MTLSKQKNMNISPIKNDSDYQAALAEIDNLMDACSNTPEGDALDIWVTLVESYEAKQFPISAPPFNKRHKIQNGTARARIK